MVARQDPPRVLKADLRADLGKIIADVPSGATLVIFHSAVLPYVPSDGREAFAADVARLGAVWVANEGADVLPAVRRQVGDNELAEHQSHFLLSRDGNPIAWADPHGSWLQWRSEEAWQ